MTIEKQLIESIKEKYKSVREFSLEIGIPYSSMKSMLSEGKLKGASVHTVIRIFDCLGLDVESISTGTLQPLKPDAPTSLSPSENQLVDNYRQLNPEGQEKVLEYADDLVHLGRYKKCDFGGVGQKEA